MCVSVQFSREDGSGSGFGSWENGSGGSVPRLVPGKTVPTVPVRFLGHPVQITSDLRQPEPQGFKSSERRVQKMFYLDCVF